jgi:hypothetical protein
MRILHAKFLHAVVTGSLGGLCAIGVMLFTLSAGATEPAVPWECSGFAEESQNRCIRTFAELQQENIAKLEKDLKAQQQAVQQLQQQVSQQALTTAELERQLTHKPSRWYGSPSVHVYPPLGLSLRFGRDRFFGRSLYYGIPRYFGPRFYGHGHRRWHHH